jgi:hypothetical protein
MHDCSNCVYGDQDHRDELPWPEGCNPPHVCAQHLPTDSVGGARLRLCWAVRGLKRAIHAALPGWMQRLWRI